MDKRTVRFVLGRQSRALLAHIKLGDTDLLWGFRQVPAMASRRIDSFDQWFAIGKVLRELDKLANP